MDELIQLVAITKKRGQRSIQLVNQNFRKKEISKDNLLYEGIVNGAFETDEAAANSMFSADPGNRNYRNAKGKLKNKLLNHLYFLDYEKDVYSLYQKTWYECKHLMHQSEILMEEGAREIAVKLLNQVVKQSTEFEFMDLATQALKALQQHWAMEGRMTAFKEVSQELAAAQQRRNVLEQCEQTYQQTTVYFHKSASAQQQVLEEIPGIITELKERAEAINSTQVHIMVHKLRLAYFDLNLQFQNTINTCTMLEQQYLQGSNQDIRVNLNRQEVIMAKLKAYLYLDLNQEALAYGHEAGSHFKQGSNEWFAYAELMFLLLMKSEEPAKATELFRKVRTQKHYNQQPDLLRQRWQIYRAYLVFFNDNKLLRWGFDLEEFLETNPSHELDGYNVATLVIQFLLLLRNGNEQGVKEKLSLLDRYNSTHLDKRHNYRNSIFIRLLEIVTDKGFHLEAVQEKGAVYFRKLQQTRIPCDLQQDLEVIPYDILWNYVLSILRDSKNSVDYHFYNAKVG